jgi:serine phosphatase RsbU (regulator of sigma subunit)
MDIALVALEGNTVRFAGANNPLWIISRGALKEVKGDQQPIGNYADKRPFTTHRVEVQPGDRIYLFSDGFVDQFGGERRRKLKFKPFREKLLAIQSMEMKEQGEELARYFDQWKRDYEQIDDVCVTGIRYTK